MGGRETDDDDTLERLTDTHKLTRHFSQLGCAQRGQAVVRGPSTGPHTTHNGTTRN